MGKKLAGLLATLVLALGLFGCTGSTKEGDSLSFTATDLAGNTVTSEQLFGGNKLTMLNIWATDCEGCVDEMPGLEELAKKTGIGIVGVVQDVQPGVEDEYYETAKQIVSTTGVTYPNLIPWDGYDDVLRSSVTPVSYFVDPTGRVVGSPIMGARDMGSYEQLINETLESLNAK